MCVGFGNVFLFIHGEGDVPIIEPARDRGLSDPCRTFGDFTLQFARIFASLYGSDSGQCHRVTIRIDTNRPGRERTRFMASALVEPGEAHSSTLALPAPGVMPVLNGVMGTTCRIIADLLRHFWPPRSTLTLGAIPVIAHIIGRQLKRERRQSILRNTTFFFFGTNENVVAPLGNEIIVNKPCCTRMLTQFPFLRRRGPQRKLVGPDNNIWIILVQFRGRRLSDHV